MSQKSSDCCFKLGWYRLGKTEKTDGFFQSSPEECRCFMRCPSSGSYRLSNKLLSSVAKFWVLLLHCHVPYNYDPTVCGEADFATLTLYIPLNAAIRSSNVTVLAVRTPNSRLICPIALILGSLSSTPSSCSLGPGIFSSCYSAVLRAGVQKGQAKELKRLRVAACLLPKNSQIIPSSLGGENAGSSPPFDDPIFYKELSSQLPRYSLGVRES